MKTETSSILDDLYSKFDTLYFIMDSKGVITETGGNIEGTGYSRLEIIGSPIGSYLFRFSRQQPFSAQELGNQPVTPTMTGVTACFFRMKEEEQTAAQRKFTRWSQVNRNWLRGRLTWQWTRDTQACVIVFLASPYLISRFVDENSFSLCAVADPDGRVIDVNENFYNTFHEHRDALIGMPLRELFAPGDYERVQNAMAGKIEDPVNRAPFTVTAAGSGKQIEALVTPCPENRLAVIKGGLSVKPRERTGYLPFRQELESHEDDVRVSFKVQLKPDFFFGLVINGYRDQPPQFMDAGAYLLQVDNRYCTLKYCSIDARKTEHRALDLQKPVQVTLGRSGSRFLFTLNDETVTIPYYAVQEPNGLGLGLFFVDGMLFDEVKIETRKGLDLSGLNRPNIVRLKRWENRYFALSIHERNYVQEGKSVFYQLSEVTQLKNISHELERLQDEARSLKKQIIELKTIEPAQPLKSNTPSMSRIYETITQIAQTSVTVLLTGETGAGKDVIARTLHQLSARKKGPFIKIDCAALSETILESELFGHEKGAFTGAIEQRTGKFEAAHNGTVYLDDIENLSLKLQTKLLSVINDRKLERLGSNKAVTLDIRIVAATNIDLMDLIVQGKFREDLYYRLNVAHLHIPPLRERMEDLPLLVSDIIKDLCRENNIVKAPVIDQKAWDWLMGQKWPGNIRELRNALQFALIRSGGKVLLPEHFYRTRPEQSVTTRNETLLGSRTQAENPAAPAVQADITSAIPKSAMKNMSPREKQMYAIIHEEGNATPKWLMDRLSISKATVWKDLKHMTRLRLLTKTGAKRGVRYQTNG